MNIHQTHSYMHTETSRHTQKHMTNIDTCINTYIIRTYAHISTYTHTHTSLHTHTPLHTRTRTHTHTHTHLHTPTHAPKNAHITENTHTHLPTDYRLHHNSRSQVFWASSKLRHQRGAGRRSGRNSGSKRSSISHTKCQATDHDRRPQAAEAQTEHASIARGLEKRYRFRQEHI